MRPYIPPIALEHRMPIFDQLSELILLFFLFFVERNCGIGINHLTYSVGEVKTVAEKLLAFAVAAPLRLSVEQSQLFEGEVAVESQKSG